MKICENCQTTQPENILRCPDCGQSLLVAKTSDGFLKKFLAIDDNILNRFKEVRENTIKEAKTRSQKSGPMIALGISGSSRSEFDSAGENSNSEFLLHAALEDLAKLGSKTELVALRDYDIEPCKACYSTTNAHCHFYCSCYPKGTPAGDDMSNILYDKILEADIIVFATPVNNFKISSLMALFIDRCISLDGSLEPANPTATKDKNLNIKHTKFIELNADEKIPGSGFLRRFTGKTAGIIVTGHEEGASMAISQLFMTLNHFGLAFPPYSNMYAMGSILNGTYADKKAITGNAYAKEAGELAKNLFTLATLLRKEKTEWIYDNSAN
jgi:multimeric flavodoxin WrbA